MKMEIFSREYLAFPLNKEKDCIAGKIQLNMKDFLRKI